MRSSFELVRRGFGGGFVIMMVVATASTASGQRGDSSHAMAGMKMDQGGSYMAMFSAASGTHGVRGMAMVSGKDVQISITGDQAGSLRPWHVHKGTCANDQGVAGDVAAFPVLSSGKDGKGSSKAVLSTALTAGEDYFVAIHASHDDMKAIIACAPLKTGKM